MTPHVGGQMRVVRISLIAHWPYTTSNRREYSLHQLGKSPSEQVSNDDLLPAAEHLSLKAKRSSTTFDRIELDIVASAPGRIVVSDGSQLIQHQASCRVC